MPNDIAVDCEYLYNNPATTLPNLTVNGGINTQGVVAANLTVLKDEAARKLLTVESAGGSVAINGDPISTSYTFTVNGATYITSDLTVMGAFLTSGFEVDGTFRAETILGSTIQLDQTLYATNGISSDGDITTSGNIELTGRSVITLMSQSIASWAEVQNYFNQTIIHKTNMVDYDGSKIGYFCETTGVLADVYGDEYAPTLERACDAIVKVRPSTTLNTRVLGVIRLSTCYR
jgi:hypothetical protein